MYPVQTDQLHASRPTVHRRPRGYTLIEVACVLAIIAILAAAGTPRFAKAIAARRAEAAARRLAADIEWLRATARVTSTSQSISFDPSTNSYTLMGFTDPDSAGAVYRVSLADGAYKSQIASINLGGSTTLSFNGYGVPTSGGSIVVQAGANARTVTIDGVTGNVAWQ